MLGDVVDIVGRGENLRLVDKVNANGIEDLAFDKVADTGLGHDGDGDGGLDSFDHSWVGHARDTALYTNVGGDTLEGPRRSGLERQFTDCSSKMRTLMVG